MNNIYFVLLCVVAFFISVAIGVISSALGCRFGIKLSERKEK